MVRWRTASPLVGAAGITLPPLFGAAPSSPHHAWGHGAQALSTKLIWRPKKKPSGKRVSFTSPLAVVLGVNPIVQLLPSVHPASGILPLVVSTFHPRNDPMLDEVLYGASFSEAQALHASKIMQLIRSAEDREYMLAALPGLNSEATMEDNIQVETVQVIGPAPSVASLQEAIRPNSEVHDIHNFLISISKPILVPLLIEQPPGDKSRNAEHIIDFPIHTLNSQSHMHHNIDNTNHNSPMQKQRRSSRLAKKAESKTGKGPIQIAEDLLVKKLNALSPKKILTELDVVEQLAQHFEQPLSERKAEAIITLVNHGKQSKGKMKKKLHAGGFVAPAPLEMEVA
jgi:hypothetical protein